ncbi:MAG: UbiA family prenyltransferase [Candidatus Nitrosocosmicus sp.]|nr:UbiA family prenyltransferase [Candidatus Nitrosocosmicus sp.]
MNEDNRLNEWFVPKFGPKRFRMFCGMLFLPYTGMCISFVVWGNLIVNDYDHERLGVIVSIYFLSLGIAAHIADNIGSKKIKPWGDFLSKRQSWVIIIICLVVSYVLGIYYALVYAPFLILIGIAEGFFLFAYNFEMFKGVFHNNFWFSISWGMLPFLAGFVIQTNSLTLKSILFSLIPFFLSYLEIRVSRLYKEDKRRFSMTTNKTTLYEIILKTLSISIITITIVLLIIPFFLQLY